MPMRLIAVMILLWGMLVLGACAEDDENNDNATNISRFNSQESHNAGRDCTSCHKPGGSGKGVFSVSGTVYDEFNDPYPNTTVELTTEPEGMGRLVAAIQVDGKGNFYTTRTIDFSDGLYASVLTPNGTVDMLDAITHGACNRCHIQADAGIIAVP